MSNKCSVCIFLEPVLTQYHSAKKILEIHLVFNNVVEINFDIIFVFALFHQSLTRLSRFNFNKIKHPCQYNYSHFQFNFGKLKKQCENNNKNRR